MHNPPPPPPWSASYKLTPPPLLGVLHPPLQHLRVIHLLVVFMPHSAEIFIWPLCHGWRGAGKAPYRHPYILVEEILSEDYKEKNSCWFQVDSTLCLMPSYFSFLYEIRKVNNNWHCFNHYCPFISFQTATFSCYLCNLKLFTQISRSGYQHKLD